LNRVYRFAHCRTIRQWHTYYAGGGAVTSVTVERFVYDGTDVVLDLRGTGATLALAETALVVKTRYMYAEHMRPGETSLLLAQENVTAAPVVAEVLWAFIDHQSTVRDLVRLNYSGGVYSLYASAHYQFDSFGRFFTGKENGVTITVPTLTRYTFTSQEYDSRLLTIDFGGRIYEPNSAKWTIYDPKSFTAGDFNLTRFMGNDPVNHTDPTGFEIFTYGPTTQAAINWIQNETGVTAQAIAVSDNYSLVAISQHDFATIQNYLDTHNLDGFDRDFYSALLSMTNHKEVYEDTRDKGKYITSVNIRTAAMIDGCGSKDEKVKRAEAFLEAVATLLGRLNYSDDATMTILEAYAQQIRELTWGNRLGVVAASTATGGATGAATGAAGGAVVGSVVPGPGTVAGATTGGISGGIWGSISGIISGIYADDLQEGVTNALWSGAVSGLLSGPLAAYARARAVAQAATKLSITDKLERYLLNLANPKGCDKAKWFQQALGFTKENAAGLAKQIKFDPAKAVQTAVTEHGTKFNQVIEIVGMNGKHIEVTFAWIRNKDGIVRLVTAIPTPR